MMAGLAISLVLILLIFSPTFVVVLVQSRKHRVSYYTVDGGHPAPYPDMTDEDLWEFENDFLKGLPKNKRTFQDHPCRLHT